MKKQETTREQLITEIETLYMEIEKLKETEVKHSEVEKSFIENEAKYPSEDIENLREILDIEKLTSLLEHFYSATGVSNSIMDLKGNILHGVGWQRICTEYHRKNEVSLERCLESDTILAKQIKEKEKYAIYICRNGMVDVATPIIIGGVIVANLFIGQFFFETPDKDFFMKQADQLGFDKGKYLQALEECPVYNKETIIGYLDFFSSLVNMIGESALLAIRQKKRAIELIIAQEKDKRAAELQRVQLLLKSSLESPKDMIILSIDKNYNYYYFNKAHQDAMKYAYAKDVAMGMNLLEMITSESDRTKAKINYELALQGTAHSTIEQYGDQAISYYETFYNPIINDCNEIVGATSFARDVSARIQAEATLRRQVASQDLLLKISRQFTGIVVENIDDLLNVALQELGNFNDADRCYIVLFSKDGSKFDTTYEWCREGILPSIDVLKNMSLDFFPCTLEQLQRFENVYISSVKDLPLEAQPEKELLCLKATQSLLLVPIIYASNLRGFLGFDSTTKNIVCLEESVKTLNLVAEIFANALQRKQYVMTIRESENYYRTIFANTGAVTLIVNEDMTISRVNEECQRLLGYTQEELRGKKWSDFISGDLVDTMKEYHRLRRLDPVAAPIKYKTRITGRNGKHQDGLVAVDIIPGTNKSVVTFINFTEFNRIDRALKAISAVNKAMIQAENEEDLLRNVCQKIVEAGGFSLVGVVYLQADLQQTIQPVASAGKDKGFLAKLNISLQDPKRGQGPTATAIRTGQSVVSRDFEKDVTIKPWLKDALRLGLKASMSIPLIEDNKAFGALCIYSSEIDRFDCNEEILLTEMANELGYAIIFLRNRAEKNQTAEELKTSLEKMLRILMQGVTSLGATLDIKDPYTAGHQRRVSHLATAIAKEMGLSNEQIAGIEVTGDLHDVGKISVPSEILNKPGKLSDIEFSLIKTHPQAGYEIVKDIEFPWPVGEVLLQHHERMNGSGYPRGLAGEDMLVEARIMAVADVVEAMSSHRPYRPALGIDAALEEISQNRGILYDPDVADICLRLFREKDFKFK